MNPRQPSGAAGPSQGHRVILGSSAWSGFGLCTLCGTVIAFDMHDSGIWILVLGGAAMTALSTWLVMTMFRKAREARERSDNRDIDRQ
jgi:uncharacterized membrane protein